MSALQKHKSRLTVYLHDSMFSKQKAPDSSNSSSSSAFDFVSYVDSVMPGNTLRNAYYKPAITTTDVAIFVSPEFSIDYYREFIRRATPRMLIVFIHEPNMELSRLQYIINMHPLVGVAALSPHVAERVRMRMNMHHVHWMMPLLPAGCSNACWEGFAVQGKFEGSRRNYATLWGAMQQQIKQQQAASGAAGDLLARHLQQSLPAAAAAASGSVQNQRHAAVGAAARMVRLAGSGAAAAARRQRLQHRRNLHSSTGGSGHKSVARAVSVAHQANTNSSSSSSADRTWLSSKGSWISSSSGSSRAMQVAGPAAAAVLPRINVLGSGKLSLLGVPAELRPWVFLYRNLGYKDYYDTLCKSLALLPLFNSSSGYLADKISSTVLTSVAVGVPMIVPPKFLEVYSAFKPEHVIVMEDDSSSELAAMSSLASPAAAATLAAKRKALEHLRYVFNQQAAAKLEGLMAAAHGRPHATTKQD